MNLTPSIDSAIRLSSHLHRHQTRKDTMHTPYSSHLFSVATLISSVTDDEDIIIAGLMHDSLEDVPAYSYEQLVKDCGPRVAEIVLHVTEPLDANKPANEQVLWLLRKEKYLENLKCGGIESAIVSTADKIHNTESFLLDVEKEGDDFMRRFGSSLRNKLWFHEQVLIIVGEKLGNDNPLVIRLALCTEQFKKLATL